MDGDDHMQSDHQQHQRQAQARPHKMGSSLEQQGTMHGQPTGPARAQPVGKWDVGTSRRSCIDH